MNRIDTKQLAIPDDIQNSWNKIVNLLADITSVPSALIMREKLHNIEVFSCNDQPDNPYIQGSTEPLKQNLYCETVINQQEELLIPNALELPQWHNNPDIKHGMIAYLGIPVNWPDGTTFGTICLLDNKANQFSTQYRSLLESFRESVEAQLTVIFQQARLIRLNNELKKRVKNRTKDLANLNYSLSQEIDKRKAAEQEVDYQKTHDRPTGFLNYDALKNQLDNKLKKLAPDTTLLVIQIGFTNGRRLQSRFGDNALSDLIVAYRQRIGNIDCLDSLTARIGMVDLVIAIETKTPDSFVENFCNRLLELSHSEFTLDNEIIHLHAYIGVSSSKESSTATALTQHAREAMLSCLESGQRFMWYAPHLSAHQHHVNQLESYLLQAVRNNDLILYFQPKVDLKTGNWKGAEALLRWNHPELGIISNESLIQMAEQNGLIFEVGSFVLRAAIEQASDWYQSIRNFRVAVNISPVQLKNKNFVQQLKHLLDTYKLPAHYLELEVTESCLISNEILAHKTLQELKHLGVTLSLDDFGTGCATFSYLKKYPFTSIKIDKSFVQNITQHDDDKDIMHSIIHVAKKMDLEVTVEGIEHLEQEVFIINEGCDYAQGYLYGKPMSCNEFSNFFVQQSRHMVN